MRSQVLSIAAVAAVVVGACGGTAPTPDGRGLLVADHGIVTTASGAAVAGTLVGPVTLQVGSVGSATCHWLVTSNGARHGAIWPFGAEASGGGIVVPGGLTILPGTPFWSGGGSGDEAGVPELGPCDAPPDFFLGGQFSLTNPVPSGG
jgi:hypothetical protein